MRVYTRSTNRADPSRHGAGKNPYAHFGNERGKCSQDMDSVKFNATKVQKAGEQALKEVARPLKHNPLEHSGRAGRGGRGARGREGGRGRGRRGGANPVGVAGPEDQDLDWADGDV